MVGTVCMVNIGPRERLKRMAFGIVCAVAAAAAFGWALGAEVDRFTRLLVVIPAWLAAIGILQARGKT
jgi:hypothetical protein